MRFGIRRLLFVAVLAVVALAAAEVAARADDLIRLGVPFARTPSYDHDLKYRDWFGVRGRPGGQFRHWRLNNVGFLGPDVSLAPRPGCMRIMVIGASETFGLYESESRDYPAQLRDSLRAHGCYEVVNSAIVGMGIKNMIRLWEHYSARFRPEIVLVYASPAFYLSNVPPGWDSMPGKPEAEYDVPFRPRLLDRVRDTWTTPDFLQRRRFLRSIGRDTAGKPADWYFRSPPRERLELFGRDLDSLVKSIRATGAEAILMTHAMRFSVPPRPEDELFLLGWRRFSPRATPDALLRFELAAADWIRNYARSERLRLVDVNAALSGKPAYFGDFVHFTDEGAGMVAGMIARQLVGSSPGR